MSGKYELDRKKVFDFSSEHSSPEPPKRLPRTSESSKTLWSDASSLHKRRKALFDVDASYLMNDLVTSDTRANSVQEVQTSFRYGKKGPQRKSWPSTNPAKSSRSGPTSSFLTYNRLKEQAKNVSDIKNGLKKKQTKDGSDRKDVNSRKDVRGRKDDGNRKDASASKNVNGRKDFRLSDSSRTFQRLSLIHI